MFDILSNIYNTSGFLFGVMHLYVIIFRVIENNENKKINFKKYFYTLDIKQIYINFWTLMTIIYVIIIHGRTANLDSHKKGGSNLYLAALIIKT